MLTDAQTCIADPAIISGDFSLEGDLCPGLLQLLDDVYNNVEDPVITCEQSCINLFDKVRRTMLYVDSETGEKKEVCILSSNIFYSILKDNRYSVFKEIYHTEFLIRLFSPRVLVFCLLLYAGDRAML